MTDSPTTPAEDEQVKPATAPAAESSPAPEKVDEPTTETAAKTPAKEAAEPATEDATPTKVAEAASAEDAPKAEPDAAPKDKTPSRLRRWLTIGLDAFLVLLLLGILAAAGYYFRLTAERYHVPTPMELLLAESEELDRRYNELLSQANQADTQLHLRARLAQLEGQMARLSSQLAEKKASIDEQHSQVLAMQYAIRQADATNRGIARSLLPGMAVGNVTTTTGRAYRNATIYRLDKHYIYLRFPEGQARLPIRQVVKDNMPELARYAFGELDLVDMSDFEQSGAPSEPTTPAKAAPTPKPAPSTAHVMSDDYDPAPGAPVLDTEANRTTTSRVPEGSEAPAEDAWEAPSGELPM